MAADPLAQLAEIIEAGAEGLGLEMPLPHDHPIYTELKNCAITYFAPPRSVMDIAIPHTGTTSFYNYGRNSLRRKQPTRQELPPLNMLGPLTPPWPRWSEPNPLSRPSSPHEREPSPFREREPASSAAENIQQNVHSSERADVVREGDSRHSQPSAVNLNRVNKRCKEKANKPLRRSERPNLRKG